ncbi:MAG: DNA translocase FtsK [Bacteroidia bacterium]|nr:DNA translocase FtsK [Bacteroidia bacterium]MDW8134798.1 DNA translocase FtsK [Bacteroidia bacterium]
MEGTPSVSIRRIVLSMGVGIVGLYILIAVLAYYVSYRVDLPALEGAPMTTPLNNPTGWIGASIAHQLIYHGFGWIGILFPIGLLYAAFQWGNGRKIRLRYIGWGLGIVYLFSTFGGWLAHVGWVEDLIWCGSVGAAFTAWLNLYIGPVGLFIVWTSLAVLFTWRVLTQLLTSTSKGEAEPSHFSPQSSPTPENHTEPREELSWYEVIRVSPSSNRKNPEEASDSKENKHVNTSSSSFTMEESFSPSATVQKQEAPAFSVIFPAENLPEAPQAPLPRTSMSVEEGWFSKKEATILDVDLGYTPSFRLPPLELLGGSDENTLPPINQADIETHKDQIVRTLQHYGIQVTRITATVGPTVTLFEIVPAPGVRISKIKSLEDDIALNLAALGIRIIAPMPGKGTIGIEVPHAQPRVVPLKELLVAPEFRQSRALLPLALGKTITDEAFVRDLAQMPHLLIAGATGQGKSVALNCMLLSLLYRLSPEQVRFVLIDPKKVEMSLYQNLESHYLAAIPGLPERIITDVEYALPALQSLVLEMEMRYELLKELQVRTISEYNRRCREREAPEGHKPLPYIVLIIDELADLMMTKGKEVETPICRLAQLARAVGIHLIVATQRPSVNVITGLIKANFPVRISFRVASRIDSRVILDMDGAERLIGRGDMLFAMGTEVLRLQSGYVSTRDIERVVEFISAQPVTEPYILPEPPRIESEDKAEETLEERDPLFYEAALLVVRNQYGSTSLLQRKLGIGFNRAGRLMDQLERAGIVGPGRGSKPREVLIQDESALQALL